MAFEEKKRNLKENNEKLEGKTHGIFYSGTSIISEFIAYNYAFITTLFRQIINWFRSAH